MLQHLPEVVNLLYVVFTLLLQFFVVFVQHIDPLPFLSHDFVHLVVLLLNMCECVLVLHCRLLQLQLHVVDTLLVLPLLAPEVALMRLPDVDDLLFESLDSVVVHRGDVVHPLDVLLVRLLVLTLMCYAGLQLVQLLTHLL